MVVQHYALTLPQFTPKVCDTKEGEERVTVSSFPFRSRSHPTRVDGSNFED